MPTNSATRAAEWREGYVNRGNWGEHVANIGQRELWVHGCEGFTARGRETLAGNHGGPGMSCRIKCQLVSPN